MSLADRVALTALYSSTAGTGWSSSSRWFNTFVESPCGACRGSCADADFAWQGVSACQFNGTDDRVSSLNYRRGGLNGTLPTQLGGMDQLLKLQLQLNTGMGGSMPTQLGALSKLDTLNLRGSGYSGTIPTQIGRLTLLTNLQLFQNSLRGALPSQLARLTSLEACGLTLTGSDISGAATAVDSNLFDCPLPALPPACRAQNIACVSSGSANEPPPPLSPLASPPPLPSSSLPLSSPPSSPPPRMPAGVVVGGLSTRSFDGMAWVLPFAVVGAVAALLAFAWRSCRAKTADMSGGRLSSLVPIRPRQCAMQNSLLTPPTCAWRPQRRYCCFLSHYKAEAGTDARYLNDLLMRVTGAPVFLDSADLADLRTLFTDGVAQADTLVLLGTASVLRRPWCLLEVCTNCSLNHSITQSLDHSITQSLNHWPWHLLEVCTNCSINHSITQSPNHSITQSLNHSINQSLNHSITQSLAVAPPRGLH